MTPGCHWQQWPRRREGSLTESKTKIPWSPLKRPATDGMAVTALGQSHCSGEGGVCAWLGHMYHVTDGSVKTSRWETSGRGAAPKGGRDGYITLETHTPDLVFMRPSFQSLIIKQTSGLRTCSSFNAPPSSKTSFYTFGRQLWNHLLLLRFQTSALC